MGKSIGTALLHCSVVQIYDKKIFWLSLSVGAIYHMRIAETPRTSWDASESSLFDFTQSHDRSDDVASIGVTQ
jgi:hypothetical protein